MASASLSPAIAGGLGGRGRKPASLRAALSRAVAAGARLETEVRTAAWGKIVVLADPFGHGLCLIEFLGRGYDEVAEAAPLKQ